MASTLSESDDNTRQGVIWLTCQHIYAQDDALMVCRHATSGRYGMILRNSLDLILTGVSWCELPREMRGASRETTDAQ